MNEDKLTYNKNSKVIIIPDGTKSIPDETFMNFDKLEEVIIPNSVEYIGASAFKGCKLLQKVKLPDNLKILGDFAFSECESLLEINIPSSLHYYARCLFRKCHNLKTINGHDDINYINDGAFYQCHSLENFDIPKNVKSIGIMAMMGCNSIKEINIPKKVEVIEVGALALMESLEKISVDEENKTFASFNNETVLISNGSVIVQYAINCDREDFTAGYYTVQVGDKSFQTLVFDIADYAFAGAKKLKKFSISSEISSIGGNTFMGCGNLKDLEIYHTPYGDTFLLNIFKINDEIEIPFENITIGEGVKTLCQNLSDLFKNVKYVSLPKSLECISENVFLESKNIDTLELSENIKMINPNTFYPELNLKFSSIGTIKAKDFNMLQTKTSDDYYIKMCGRDNISVFSLKDGTYYVKNDDFDIIKITREQIMNFSDASYMMVDNPDELVMYIYDLLKINADYNATLMNIWSNPKLEENFNQYVNDFNYIKEIAIKKTNATIIEILNNSGIKNEFLFSYFMTKRFNREEITKIILNYNNSINRFFKLGILDKMVSINIDKLIGYCNILAKYHQYNKFLYNPTFFEKLTLKNQELLVKYFNKNIKYLLVNSQTLNDTGAVNLNDLLNLCNALGIFCDEERFSQKMCTFLNEKIINKDSSTPIVGNDIHTMFGEINPRDEIDYEFIILFIENYKRLIELEKRISGIISRIYNNFRDISNTSTSHKGSQRHLKVTLGKCFDYLLSQRFEGVTDDNKELAYFLQRYYSESSALNIGEMIIKQSQNAPRNIFTKVNFDNNKPIYSYDSCDDLVENNVNGFSYHWLPKQDYNNLVLGKYCNCCAHLLGEGAGIMRASMILDNCQNLVIKNNSGIIVAKMTIYVNKEQGYAVFNTAEVSLNYRDDNALDGIYEAFMRGVNAFVAKYNENNIVPISIVSIGEYRNCIKDNLGNIETQLYQTPNYSSYGYCVGNKNVGTYDGDSKNKQLLVLKL